MDNACPLCGYCHTLYGNNPDLRKQLCQMRDFWWEHCVRLEQYPDVGRTYEKLDKLRTELEVSSQDQQRTNQILNEIKSLLVEHHKATSDRFRQASTFLDITIASTST